MKSPFGGGAPADPEGACEARTAGLRRTMADDAVPDPSSSDSPRRREKLSYLGASPWDWSAADDARASFGLWRWLLRA